MSNFILVLLGNVTAVKVLAITLNIVVLNHDVLVYSSPHEFRKCDKKRDGAKVIDVKCPNCKRNHTGNYGGCPYYQTAKAVEKVRVKKNLK